MHRPLLPLQPKCAILNIAEITASRPIRSDSNMLIECMAQGHMDVARCLLETRPHDKRAPNPADYNELANWKNPIGCTPVFAAAQNGHLDLLKLFLEHLPSTNQHLAANNGVTPVSIACQEGHLEVVKYLFDKGVDKNQVHRTDKGSLLHVAARSGQLAVLELLLQQCSALQDVPDLHGATPLFCACQNGHLEVSYPQNFAPDGLQYFVYLNLCSRMGVVFSVIVT